MQYLGGMELFEYSNFQIERYRLSQDYVLLCKFIKKIQKNVDT